MAGVGYRLGTRWARFGWIWLEFDQAQIFVQLESNFYRLATSPNSRKLSLSCFVIVRWLRRCSQTFWWFSFELARLGSAIWLPADASFDFVTWLELGEPFGQFESHKENKLFFSYFTSRVQLETRLRAAIPNGFNGLTVLEAKSITMLNRVLIYYLSSVHNVLVCIQVIYCWEWLTWISACFGVPFSSAKRELAAGKAGRSDGTTVCRESGLWSTTLFWSLCKDCKLVRRLHATIERLEGAGGTAARGMGMKDPSHSLRGRASRSLHSLNYWLLYWKDRDCVQSSWYGGLT